ncbi:MAG TPA: biopolymer transporter ExbD [Gammaproteobacteria bacterium]|nr:biopolymer transporter ExbD [Gammaproteobacteria bacterium]
MRKRRHANPADEEADINLAPMLDIVFIMLIFFVVTTSFVKESGIDINRPTAQTAERREHGNILIAIAPNGEIWIDKRVVDIRSVRAVIERLMAQNPEGGVIIQGDRAARIGLLVEVMDQVRKGGVSNVSIAATPTP